MRGDGSRRSASARHDASARPRRWFADKIVAASQRAVTGIIEIGRLLEEAKSELDHGEFSRLFDDLPFSQRTGQRYMAIAANRVLTKATHASHLPPCWYTLYQLSRLPDEVLEALLSQRIISPDMERQELAEIIRKATDEGRDAHIDWLPRRIKTFAAYVKKWPDAAISADRIDRDASLQLELAEVDDDDLVKLTRWLKDFLIAWKEKQRRWYE